MFEGAYRTVEAGIRDYVSRSIDGFRNESLGEFTESLISTPIPIIGAGGALSGTGAYAANLTRALRLPNFSTSLGRGVLGATDAAGNVTIAAGLTRAEQVLTLRHESVHAFFSARGTGLIAHLRQQLGMWGYNNSQLLRYTEEALAEGYATTSVRQGLMHPLSNGYGITPFGLFFEGSIFGGAFYAGYELTNGD